MPVHDGIQLSQKAKLTFNWNVATDIPHAVLKVTNNAMFTVVANIKTTNPTRYKVTPPNAVIKNGEQVSIKFQFAEKDAVLCWNQRMGDIKSDRFMIQTAKVFSMDADTVPQGDDEEAKAALAVWWAAKAEEDKAKPKDKKQIRAQKLESAFVFPGEPGSATWGNQNMENQRLMRKYEDLEHQHTELKMHLESVEADREMIKSELETAKSELISALTMQTGLQMALSKAQAQIAAIKGGESIESVEAKEREQSSLFSSFCACGIGGGEGDEVAAGLAADDAVHSLAPPVEVEYTFRQAAIGLDLRFDADLDTIAVVNVTGQAAQLGVRKGDLVKKLNGRELLHPDQTSSVTDEELLKLLDALPRPVKVTFVRHRSQSVATPPPPPRR